MLVILDVNKISVYFIMTLGETVTEMIQVKQEAPTMALNILGEKQNTICTHQHITLLQIDLTNDVTQRCRPALTVFLVNLFDGQVAC